MDKMSIKDLPRIEPLSATKRLFITLPVPPSVNHMYFNTKGGGKRLTGKAEQYIRSSKALINLAVDEQHWIKSDKGVWLYVDLVFYFPDRRIRDASNCLKLLLDVMQDNVYTNDMYALPRIQSVEYDKENPRVEVCIFPQSNNARDKGLQLACN